MRLQFFPKLQSHPCLQYQVKGPMQSQVTPRDEVIDFFFVAVYGFCTILTKNGTHIVVLWRYNSEMMYIQTE